MLHPLAMGSDFGPPPAITIPDMSPSAELMGSISILDDDILEDTENFTISFPSTDECITPIPSVTVSIVDDDGMFRR